MPIRIHLVAGYVHRDICEEMVRHASAIARELDSVIEEVTWIPGSLEAPLAVKRIIDSKRPDAVVVFGVQEQGQTRHGDVIAQQVTGKLLDLQLTYMMPMAVAIIGPGASLEHAAGKAEYTSQKALRAAVHMFHLMQGHSSC